MESVGDSSIPSPVYLKRLSKFMYLYKRGVLKIA